jgi:protein-S-isoprenylcysteine O-methyltransferase Ste14
MTGPEPDRTETSRAGARRANTFPWPPVLLVACFAAAWALGRVAPVGWPGLDDVAAHAIGIGFGIGGSALILWSIVTLSRAGTTVMPNGVSTALVTSGPYTRFRNPIYLGEVLLLLFAAEITKNFWFALAALVFAILITGLQIIPEERHLSAQFGEAYDTYRARSRRWI